MKQERQLTLHNLPMQGKAHKCCTKHKHTKFKDYWETHKHETELLNIRNNIGQIMWLETTNREANSLNSSHNGLK